MTDIHWREDALCSQTDPEAFYPDRGPAPTLARNVCSRCPVKNPCLLYAITNNETHGVWGGTTPNERQKMRARAIREGLITPNN